MAIDPSQSIPDDVATVSSLQSMTEESAKALMRAPIDAAWEGAKLSLGGILNAIGLALQGILQGGLFSSIDQASLYLTDGQEALADEIELLSPLLDYGSVCMPAGQPHQGQGMLPFSRQIGPMRGVEIVHAQGGSGLRVGGPGG